MRRSNKRTVARKARSVSVAVVFLLTPWIAHEARAADPPDRTEPAPFAIEDYIVVPLRVHILTSTDLPAIDCHLTDADLARILKKVNGIWHKAGIHWGLESLIREPAEQTDRFLRLQELTGEDQLEFYRVLLPEKTRRGKVFNIYYIHDFSVNGVWLGGEAVVKETASLREVEGGIDEPIPRVSAHELGHALGLPHHKDVSHLLASGTTGTHLDAEEAKIAREGAEAMAGALRISQLREQLQAAELAADQDSARRLKAWLTEISQAAPDQPESKP